MQRFYFALSSESVVSSIGLMQIELHECMGGLYQNIKRYIPYGCPSIVLQKCGALNKLEMNSLCDLFTVLAALPAAHSAEQHAVKRCFNIHIRLLTSL